MQNCNFFTQLEQRLQEICQFSPENERILIEIGRLLGRYYLGFPLSKNVQNYEDLRQFSMGSRKVDLDENETIDRTQLARSLPAECSPKLPFWILVLSGRYHEALWYLQQFNDIRSNLMTSYIINIDITRNIINDVLEIKFDDVMQSIYDGNDKDFENEINSLIQSSIQFDSVFNTSTLQNIEQTIMKKMSLLTYDLPLMVSVTSELPRNPIYMPLILPESRSNHSNLKYRALRRMIFMRLQIMKYKHSSRIECCRFIYQLLRACKLAWKDSEDYSLKAQRLILFFERLQFDLPEKYDGNNSSNNEESIFKHIIFIIMRDQFSYHYRLSNTNQGSEAKLRILAEVWSPLLTANQRIELVGMLFIIGIEVESTHLERNSMSNDQSSKLLHWIDKIMDRCKVEELQEILSMISYIYEKHISTTNLPCFCETHQTIWKDHLLSTVNMENPTNDKECMILPQLLPNDSLNQSEDERDYSHTKIMLNFISKHLMIPRIDSTGTRKINMNLNVTVSEILRLYSNLPMIHESVQKQDILQRLDQITLQILPLPACNRVALNSLPWSDEEFTLSSDFSTSNKSNFFAHKFPDIILDSSENSEDQAVSIPEVVISEAHNPPKINEFEINEEEKYQRPLPEFIPDDDDDYSIGTISMVESIPLDNLQMHKKTHTKKDLKFVPLLNLELSDESRSVSQKMPEKVETQEDYDINFMENEISELIDDVSESNPPNYNQIPAENNESIHEDIDNNLAQSWDFFNRSIGPQMDKYGGIEASPSDSDLTEPNIPSKFVAKNLPNLMHVSTSVQTDEKITHSTGVETSFCEEIEIVNSPSTPSKTQREFDFEKINENQNERVEEIQLELNEDIKSPAKSTSSSSQTETNFEDEFKQSNSRKIREEDEILKANIENQDKIVESRKQESAVTNRSPKKTQTKKSYLLKLRRKQLKFMDEHHEFNNLNTDVKPEKHTLTDGNLVVTRKNGISSHNNDHFLFTQKLSRTHSGDLMKHP